MKGWVNERFEAYARACVLAAVTLTPVVFLKSTQGVFAVSKLAILWSLTALGLAAWAIWRLGGGAALPKSWFVRFGGLFVVIAVLATAFSPFRTSALVGQYFAYIGLLPLELYFVFGFLVFALFWGRPLGLHSLCVAGATGALLVTGYQLIQEIGLDWHRWQVAGGAAPWEGGTFGNPNFTGGYLGASLPFILYLILKAPDSTVRKALVAGLVLQVVALWLTASRGGLAAGIVAAAVFGAAYLSDMPPRLRRGALAGAGLVAVLATAAIVQAIRGPAVPGMDPTVLGVSVSPRALLEIRVDFWKAAVGIIADRPILGTGPDTYYANYPGYRPAENGADPGLELENNPHNIFLAHGVGTGLLGLGAYLLLLGYAGMLALRRIRRAKDSELKLLLVTFSAVGAAYVTQGLVSVDHVPLALLGWVAVAAIAALAEPQAEAARRILEQEAVAERRRQVRRRLTVPVVSILLGTALLLFLGARFLLADIRAHQGQSDPSPSDRAPLLSQAIELNPSEAEYYFLAASALHFLGVNGSFEPPVRDRIFREARALYASALRRRPQSVIFLVALARLDSARGQLVDRQHFVTAARTWRTAISYDRHNYRWHFQYSHMLKAAAEADNNNRQLRLAQIGELQTSIGIYRNQPEAWRALEEAYRSIGDQARADAAHRAFFGIAAAPPVTSPPGGAEVPAPAAPSTASRVLGLAISSAALLAAGTVVFRRVTAGLRASDRLRKRRPEVTPDVLHELLAAAGLASLAMAVPIVGPLSGVGLSSGELKEILLHLPPGAAALALGVVYSSRPYSDRLSLGPLEDRVPAITAATATISLVVHAIDLFAARGPSVASGIMFHALPLVAILALVSATNEQRRRSTPRGPAPRKARESAGTGRARRA